MMYLDSLKVKDKLVELEKTAMYLEALAECMGYDEKLKYVLDDLASKIKDNTYDIQKALPEFIEDDVPDMSLDEP